MHTSCNVFLNKKIIECNFLCRSPSCFSLSKASEMDHHWVATSWLNDVGLPQYSQTFQSHLVDGRLLNSLNRRDLERSLNISDQNHQTSLLLAIQLLQIVNFDKEVSAVEL